MSGYTSFPELCVKGDLRVARLRTKKIPNIIPRSGVSQTHVASTGLSAVNQSGATVVASQGTFGSIRISRIGQALIISGSMPYTLPAGGGAWAPGNEILVSILLGDYLEVGTKYKINANGIGAVSFSRATNVAQDIRDCSVSIDGTGPVARLICRFRLTAGMIGATSINIGFTLFAVVDSPKGYIYA